MPPHSWINLVLLVGCFWIVAADPNVRPIKEQQTDKVKSCLRDKNTNYIVADNFYGIISASKHFKQKTTDAVRRTCDTTVYNNCKQSNLPDGLTCEKVSSDICSSLDPERKHTVACEESEAQLQCDEGEVISVTSAKYGRSDQNTCSTNRPIHQITNDQCSSSSNKVAERCNGKQNCSITAENSLFGDPCPGTSKYLEVGYTCKSSNWNCGSVTSSICSELIQASNWNCGSVTSSICSELTDQIKSACGSSLTTPCFTALKGLVSNQTCTTLTSGLCTNLDDTINRTCNSSISNICSNIGRDNCIIFLQKDSSNQKILWKNWPQAERKDNNLLLYIPKQSVKNDNVTLYVMGGNCIKTPQDASCIQKGPVYTKTLCGSSAGYDKTYCETMKYEDKYTINATKDIRCVNCDNPIKQPDEKIEVNIPLEQPLENEDGGVDASGAAELVSKMKDLISLMNGTSAKLSVGKGVEGIIVKKTDPEQLDEVSFAYRDPQDDLKIIEDSGTLETFSRSVTLSQEAFQIAVSSNISIPFAVVLRILNISQDENNSTLLGNEVLAIDMGAEIKNLTDTIDINFKQLAFDKQIPSCHSWNGNGSKPNWTDEGCETIVNGNDIQCRCSHLTFFAILMSPINETISSSDLNTLTIITQVGCGLSIFFLGIILFMYCLIRKTKASTSTQILIHLVCALFLLNFTFVINHFVAKLNSDVGCQIMAAVMHYSMLATFSWFAAQGFHLCLQLYRGGNIAIKRYLLKVSVTTWILPSIAVLIIGILKKYGKQTIYTDNPANDVAMCWINDNNVHYIVNVGYYAVVFLFTFTTVVIMLSWLFCMKRTKAANQQETGSGRKVVIILGLCCQLGITWGFAFFAYGSFRMIATYIFTILNSFQGFFLFIYYYKTTRVGPSSAKAKGNSGSTNTSISTLKTGLECVVNPYVTFDKQKDT